jgi:hypothetical protein
MASTYPRSLSAWSHELCTDLHAWEQLMVTASSTRSNFMPWPSHTQTGISSPTLASTCPYSRDRSSLANQRHPRPIREAALYLIILLACLQDAIGQGIYRRTIEPQTLLNT